LLVERERLLPEREGIVELTELIGREADIVEALGDFRIVDLLPDRKRRAILSERVLEIALLFGNDAAIVVKIGEARAIAHAFQQRLDLVEIRLCVLAVALDRLRDSKVAQRLHETALVINLLANVGRARVLLDRIIELAEPLV